MFHCASVGVSPAACAADRQICTRQSTDTQIQSFTPTQQQDSTLERTTFGKKKRVLNALCLQQTILYKKIGTKYRPHP